MRHLLLLVLMFVTIVPVEAASKKEAAVPAAVTLKEVQAGIMSFADTWADLITQSSNYLADTVATPEAELQVKRFQFYSRLSAYDIAAGRNPGVSMLDMMVLSSLTRSVWENHWLDIYGEPAKPLIKVLYELEGNIWRFAENILTPRQIEAMSELVTEWSAEHPNARAANFVRLSDFGELGRKPSIEKVVKKGGLLSPIRDAAQTAEDFEELAERGIYLSLRMQELIAGRLEITLSELINNREILQLFDDVHGFRQSAERYAELLESMPEEINGVTAFALAELSRERSAAIEQMLEGVAIERSGAIDQMLQGVSEERTRTLNQVLDGIRVERVGLLKAVAQIIYWLELEMEALVVRLFVIFAGLITLWYSLRLVYRYWIDRVANNFIKTVGALILIIISSAPIVLLGAYLVTRFEPDLSTKAEFSDELELLINEHHNDEN